MSLHTYARTPFTLHTIYIICTRFCILSQRATHYERHIAICFGLARRFACSDHLQYQLMLTLLAVFFSFQKNWGPHSFTLITPTQLKLIPWTWTPSPSPSRKGEPTQQKVIDTRNLTEEDLKTLKKQDPFLYFSIPAVRTATLLNRDVDMASLQGGQCSRRASCPSRIESTPPTTTKVERRTCISFECHTDLLLEDFFDEMADDDEFDSMFRQLPG